MKKEEKEREIKKEERERKRLMDPIRMLQSKYFIGFYAHVARVAKCDST